MIEITREKERHVHVLLEPIYEMLIRQHFHETNKQTNSLSMDKPRDQKIFSIRSYL